MTGKAQAVIDLKECLITAVGPRDPVVPCGALWLLGGGDLWEDGDRV